MTLREMEDREFEFGARFDDVRERFSGEFAPCWTCGVMTVDAAGHCPGDYEGPAPFGPPSPAPWDYPACPNDRPMTDEEVPF